MGVLDGSDGGHHASRHVPHAEPRLYVTVDHRGQAQVGGCARCAGIDDAVAALRGLADRIEGTQQQNGAHG